MLSTSFSMEIDIMLVFCYFVTVNYKTPQNKWLKSIIANYNLGIISKNRVAGVTSQRKSELFLVAANPYFKPLLLFSLLLYAWKVSSNDKTDDTVGLWLENS